MKSSWSASVPPLFTMTVGTLAHSSILPSRRFDRRWERSHHRFREFDGDPWGVNLVGG